MRKSFWIVLALLSAALVVAPNAHADSYTYSFVGAGIFAGTTFSIVDPTGPISDGAWYQSSEIVPGELIVAGYGGDLGLIQAVSTSGNGTVNAPFYFLPTVFTAGGDVSGNIEVSSLTDLSAVGEYNADKGWGVLDITSSSMATPEPSSFGLVLAVGLLLALRKLIA
jgi:hypothetical protein